MTDVADGELTSDLLVRAVRIFIEHAYPDGKLPANRQTFAELDPTQSLEVNLQRKWVESSTEPTGGTRWSLRVGNAWYPHMKLVVSPVGLQGGVVFSVDSHDALTLPAGSPEEAAFRELQDRNRELATAIEQAWESAGLPTQSSLLRQYLKSAGRDASPQDGSGASS